MVSGPQHVIPRLMAEITLDIKKDSPRVPHNSNLIQRISESHDEDIDELAISGDGCDR
jgi:hypothetical protein